MAEIKTQTLDSYLRVIEISRDLASTLDLDTLLEDIVHAAADITHAEAASILLYDDTARQLEATLTLQRQRLSPKTIATVERSLAVIDSAIDEARRALLEDPSNRALVDIFAANYERKLDFLRRATELTSSL